MSATQNELDPFEQQLRSELLAVLPPREVHLDAHEILTAGRRVRSGRAVLTGLVAATVLAVGAIVGLTLRGGGDGRAQVATSLPPGSTIMTVPGPSSSTMSWRIEEDGGQRAVVFRLLGPDGWTTSSYAPNALGVDDTTTATFAWPQVFDKSHIVGLLPDPDASLSVIVHANGRWANTEAVVVSAPQLGRSVFAVELDPAAVLPDSVGFDGLVWFDREGVPVDLTGRRGQVAHAGRTQVFVAADGGLWGASVPGRPLVTGTVTSQRVLTVGPGATRAPRTVVGLVQNASLPPGPVTAVLSDGSTVSTVALALGDRRVVSVDAPGTSTLTQVRWIAADGTRRTVDLG